MKNDQDMKDIKTSLMVLTLAVSELLKANKGATAAITLHLQHAKERGDQSDDALSTIREIEELLLLVRPS